MVRLLKASEAKREKSVKERVEAAHRNIQAEVGPQEFFPVRVEEEREGSRSAAGEHVGPTRLQKQQGKHTLHLIYSTYGCDNPMMRWGFDETFPDLLAGRMHVEHWEDAISQLNGGYLQSRLVKLVWLPLILLVVVGAVLEGALRSGINAQVPTGVLIGVFTGAGLLLTLVWFFYSRSVVEYEMQRLVIVCSQLSEKYGQLGITFDVEQDTTRKAVAMIVHEANVQVDIKYLQPRTLDTDTHVIQVNVFDDHTQLELTERRRPLREVPAGSIFVIGQGEKTEREVRLAQNPETREPAHGWCSCMEESRKYAAAMGCSGGIDAFLGEQSLVHRAHTDLSDGTRAISRVLWNGTSLRICPVCNAPQKE